MGMYDIKTAKYSPDNFFSGSFPISKEPRMVEEDVKQYQIVALSGTKVKPLAPEITTQEQAAVYAVAIAKAYAAEDTITLNGVTYTAVASDPVAADRQFLAGDAAAVAGSIDDAIALVETDYTVTSSGSNVTLAQKVAAPSDVPALETNVEAGCSVSVTTPYTPAVAELTDAVAKTIYGIAADDAAAGEHVVVYLTGEYNAKAVVVPEGLTVEDIQPYLRNLSIHLQ